MAAFDLIPVKNYTSTLDSLLFHYYGKEIPDLVEATLRANVGVAAMGPILTKGTMIRVPQDVARKKVTFRKLIRLTK